MIRIFVKFYFDREVQLLGILMIVIGSWLALIFFESWIAFTSSMILGAALFSTHYEVTVNDKEKYYQRSVNILGFRTGAKLPFENIINCEIVKGEFTDIYMVGPFGLPSTGNLYHAFLNFSDGSVLQIGMNKDRSKIVERVNNFRYKFGFPFIDRIDDKNQFESIYTKIAKTNRNRRTGKNLVIIGIILLLFGLSKIYIELLEFRIIYYNTLFLAVLGLTGIFIGAIKINNEQKNIAR